MTRFSSSSAFCQTELLSSLLLSGSFLWEVYALLTVTLSLSILCILALCVSLWPGLPASRPLSHSLSRHYLPFSSLLSPSLLLCHPAPNSSCFLLCHLPSQLLSWNTTCSLTFTDCLTHTTQHSDTYRYTEVDTHISKGRSKVRRGHNLPSEPQWLFPRDTRTLRAVLQMYFQSSQLASTSVVCPHTRHQQIRSLSTLCNLWWATHSSHSEKCQNTLNKD